MNKINVAFICYLYRKLEYFSGGWVKFHIFRDFAFMIFSNAEIHHDTGMKAFKIEMRKLESYVTSS